MTDRTEQTAADREALLELLLADEGIELASPGIGRRAAEEPAVLSYPQERMWFLDEFEDDTAALGNFASVALRGPLDVAALTRSLDEIVRRHEILRTVIVAKSGQPRPVVRPIETMPLMTVDVDGDEDALAEVLAAAAVHTFDLANEPPIVVTLVRVDDRHHVLAIMVHHIASDGASLGIFFREVAALYSAFVDGRPSPLPPLAVQYEDFASWQRGEAADVFQRQLEYWRNQLAGPLPTFEIPPDFSRPARHTFAGAALSARLPAETRTKIEALCKGAGATTFMGLLAGFEVVASRHAGQDDVVIGTPVAGRVRLELEPMIGAFLNMLALRNDLGDRPTFRELLDRVRDTNIDAYANQDVPFDLVLADLQLPRDLSRTPVFQILFNMTQLEVGRNVDSMTGLHVESLVPPVFGAKFDLTMYVNESAEGIDLRLVYNSCLYDRAHMARLLDQYVNLLGQVAADPDQRIDAYPLVDGRDAAAVLPDPAAPLDHSWQGSVPALIQAVAQRSPERVAVVDRSNRWTYEALARQMRWLASWLDGEHLGRRDVVAIYGHRSGSLVWSVSGVLAAGAVYLLLDSRYPPSRLAQLLRIARPKAWIALDGAGAVPVEVLDALDSIGVAHRLSIPNTADVAELQARLDPDIGAGGEGVGWMADDIGPDDPACLTFTSGSTGQPKAVIGRHGSLTHFLPWMSEVFGVGEQDRFSMLSGLSHDPLQRDMFWPLSIGATVVVPDAELMGSPGYLAQWLRDEKVTVAHLTPAMGQLVAEGMDEGSRREVTIDSLRLALFIGDVLTREQVHRLWALAPDVRVVNLYGTTETQRASGYHVLDREESAPEGARLKEVLPLGRGMPGSQLLVQTPTGAPAAVGEVGQIVMRSPHLALGYWGDDELTAVRFRPDPHGTDDRDQIYATGDQGRYRPDGLVEFLGRTDGQVQLRGFRIELGEVAAALRLQDGVADAVVDLRCDGTGGQQLVGYAVPIVGTTLDEARLLHALRAALPAHMVPSEIVELARVPLTPNGKVDRRALPAPARLGVGLHGPVTAPRDALEEALVEIWRDVLGRSEIGVHDDFFALGGYSLLATRVLARIQDRTGARAAISALFEHPTIAGLATAIRAGGGGAAPAAPIVPVTRDAPVPASPAQQRLLFMDRFAGGPSVHNLPIVLRLRGELDGAALRWSVEQLLRRHEALRTDFLATTDGWDQVVVDADDAVLEWQDEASSGWDKAVDRVRDEVRRPFDLADGPKLRALLVHLGDGDQLFALTMHHIAVDGWSIRRLLAELVELYRSRVEGRPAALRDLPVQYLDYAAWQHDELDSDATREGVAYWRAHLAGPLPVLDLPADLPRPAVQTYRGGTLHVEVPADVYERVRAAARAAGVTPFTFLLAGYVAVLARWSGQDDFVVGTATANRVRPELDDVVGLFMNTLALRTPVDVDRPFRELLESTKQTMLGAFEHEGVPFDRVVEAINPTRDVSRSVVFQTTFVLNNLPLPDHLELAGVHAEPVALSAGATDQDLAVSVVELADRAAVRVEYNADVFAAGTVERLMEHWRRLLAAAATDPTRTVAGLDLLPDGERALIERWSRGRAAPVPAALRLDQLVARRAAEDPTAVAVVAGGESVTYAELMERSHRLARALVDAGVGPGERVGVAVDRSVAMVATLLGVLETGAAYVPLDPDFPPDRLAFMVDDAGVRVVVTSAGSLTGRLDTSGLTVLDVVDDAATIDGGDGSPLPMDGAGAPGTAYVIYTSGSTGVPKGVEVGHANAVNLLQSMLDEPGLTAGDVLLAVTTLSFDISVLEIFGPLVAGGRLVVAGRDDASDGRRLAELIASSAATVVQATPTTWSMLFDAGWAGDRRLTVLCGGEAMPTHLGRRLHDACGPVWNMFGPTETTIWSTVQPVDAAALEHRTVPIGRPIANTVCRVLDADRRPAPIGVPGELYIGGAGVARGYLHRPELTAERFVPDPFVSDRGARLYRTGDLARWRPDGAIEFLGRVDFQVKVRGHRIELGEIEAALRSHPAVADVVVVADGQAGEGRLIAYPIFAGPAAPSVADLRAWLHERLPDYMVPSRFVPVDAFPLTPNRKIDRKALPTPDDAGGATGTPFMAPRTDIERVVARIVAETVGVERVGVDDDFFELGGHSLHATSVLAKIESAFGRRLELRAFFLSPTVASLAASLEAGAGRMAAPIVPVDRGGPVPASSQQERLLFVDQFARSSVFNLPIAERLIGDLDEGALRSAVAEVLRRHESLRTVFELGEDGWNQIVLGPDEVELPWIAGEVVAGWDEAVARVRAEAARPFDARTDVKIRGMLLRVGREWAFLLTMHHIAVDGWSIRRLITEIVELYRAGVEHRPVNLPELPVHYLDYTVWQRQRIDAGEYAEGLAYWIEHLRAPLPVLDLPADHPRPAVQSFAAETVTTTLPAALLAAVRQAARAHGVTPFVFLLSAYVATLARWSGQDDVVVGTAAANRANAELDDVVGMFVNTLALRTPVDVDQPFTALLETTKQAVLGAFEHQSVPFDRVVEAINPPRDLRRSVVFQTMFVLNTIADGAPVTLPRLDTEPIEVSTGSTENDVSVMVIEHGDAAYVRTAFNRAVFDAPTVERLMLHWQHLLAAAVAESDRPVASLPMMPDSERCLLLGDFAAPAPPPQPIPGVHRLDQLVALRVLATPDRVAFEHRGTAVTYRQLDVRVNQLAHRLIAAGVVPGDRVGVAVERSVGMVMAVLAVLKVGAAYVPLDPSLPSERLSFMIGDSEASAVVASPGALPDDVDVAAAVLIDLEDDDGVDGDAPPVVVDTSEHPGGGAAWVIYTSGSTGRPKGVEVEHASAINFVLAMLDAPGMDGDDVLLAVPTLSFDPSVMDLFVPPMVGAKVVIADREDVLDARRLARLIDTSGATVMQATPTTWSMLLESGWPGSPRMKALCGGEAMPVELARRLVAVCRSVWNMYGPTETTVWSAAHEVSESSLHGVNVPVGRPIGGMVYRIVDADGRLVPIGVPGEVVIGGAGVARGYVNRAELTSERFVPDPFDPAGRVYRTGDLARWRPDGGVEFLGRLDFQVKLRGNRIELGEIEAALRDQPEVADAVVVAHGVGVEQQLDAYLVPTAPTVVAPAAGLRPALRARLPDYMVPATFTWLEAFPLTASRKIDRTALAAPQEAPVERRVDAGPSDALEGMLVDVWQAVLGRKHISVHDDFFALGGYSLLATRLFAMVEARTGKRLPVSVLFEHPTIAELAEAVRNEGWRTEWSSLVAIQPAGTQQPFFYVTPYLISVLELAPLGDELGRDRPLYGLQPQGLDGTRPPHTTIPEMAAHYISEMKSVQPEGPYAIGGHCAGSWVAFEVARQLAEAGEEVSALVLVDQGPPGVERPPVKPLRYIMTRLRFYTSGGRLRYAVAFRLKVSIARFLLRRVGPPTARFEASVREVHRQAHRKYAGGRVKQDITVILSEDSLALEDRAWYTRWTELTDGHVTTRHVGGTHANLLVQPFVRQLATEVSDVLSVEHDRVAPD